MPIGDLPGRSDVKVGSIGARQYRISRSSPGGDVSADSAAVGPGGSWSAAARRAGHCQPPGLTATSAVAAMPSPKLATPIATAFFMASSRFGARVCRSRVRGR